MWPHCSEVLAPLSHLTSKNVPFKRTDIEQKAFNEMLKIIGKHVLLSYPNFDKKIDIYTDASHTQLGAVIMQEGKPRAFYSRKLNPAQTHYNNFYQ